MSLRKLDTGIPVVEQNISLDINTKSVEQIKILFSRASKYEHTGRVIRAIIISQTILVVCEKLGDNMGNLQEKELPRALEEIIKNETFDEFLLRAYQQLTPEEQIQVRHKS